MKRILLASVLCSLLGSSGAFADEPPWKTMKPFCLPEFSIGGQVYKPGVAAIKLEYRYTKKDELYQGSSHIDHPGVGPASIRQQLFFLGFRYGIIDRLDFRVQLPLLFMNIKDAAGTSLANPNGIGDVGVLVRYQILNPTMVFPSSCRRGSALGPPQGVRTPTAREPAPGTSIRNSPSPTYGPVSESMPSSFRPEGRRGTRRCGYQQGELRQRDVLLRVCDQPLFRRGSGRHCPVGRQGQRQPHRRGEFRRHDRLSGACRSSQMAQTQDLPLLLHSLYHLPGCQRCSAHPGLVLQFLL